jgi:hypothetical protein
MSGSGPRRIRSIKPVTHFVARYQVDTRQFRIVAIIDCNDYDPIHPRKGVPLLAIPLESDPSILSRSDCDLILLIAIPDQSYTWFTDSRNPLGLPKLLLSHFDPNTE